MHCESELAERSDFVPRSSSRLSGSAQLKLTKADESLGAILWTVASKIWFLLADRIVPTTGFGPEFGIPVRLPAIRKFRDPKPTCRYRSAKFLEAHFLLANLRVADDTSEEVGTLESKLPGETIPWVPANELLTANDRSDVETGDASRCGPNTCSSYKGET